MIITISEISIQKGRTIWEGVEEEAPAAAVFTAAAPVEHITAADAEEEAPAAASDIVRDLPPEVALIDRMAMCPHLRHARHAIIVARTDPLMVTDRRAAAHFLRA